MKNKTKKKKAQHPIVVAAKRLERIEKLIAPYVVDRKIKRVSTTGKWREESRSHTSF